MLAKTFGSAVYGVEAVTITVEVSVYPGALSYIVGLPDSASQARTIMRQRVACRVLL